MKTFLILGNNPPAFPPNAGWRDDDKNCRGMTLRDYFAAKAMQATLSNPYTGKNLKKLSKEDQAHFVTQNAYQVADAMLKARKNTNDNNTTGS